MKPTPAYLLCQTASISAPDTAGRYDGGFSAPVVYSHVLIQPITSKTASSWAMEPETTGVLYIDAKTSDPAEAPAEGSRVICGGTTAMVGTIKVVNDPYTGTVHHWEVGLK